MQKNWKNRQVFFSTVNPVTNSGFSLIFSTFFKSTQLFIKKWTFGHFKSKNKVFFPSHVYFNRDLRSLKTREKRNIFLVFFQKNSIFNILFKIINFILIYGKNSLRTNKPSFFPLKSFRKLLLRDPTSSQFILID